MSSVGSRTSRFDFPAGRFLESAETSTVIVRVSRLVACLYRTPGSPRKAFCILATITYPRHSLSHSPLLHATLVSAVTVNCNRKYWGDLLVPTV